MSMGRPESFMPSSEAAATAPDRLLTVAEVAELLRLTRKGVYSLVAGRRIPFLKISNRVRFSHADVVDWLRKNRVSALEKIP